MYPISHWWHYIDIFPALLFFVIASPGLFFHTVHKISNNVALSYCSVVRLCPPIQLQVLDPSLWVSPETWESLSLFSPDINWRKLQVRYCLLISPCHGVSQSLNTPLITSLIGKNTGRHWIVSASDTLVPGWFRKNFTNYRDHNPEQKRVWVLSF